MLVFPKNRNENKHRGQIDIKWPQISIYLVMSEGRKRNWKDVHNLHILCIVGFLFLCGLFSVFHLLEIFVHFFYSHYYGCYATLHRCFIFIFIHLSKTELEHWIFVGISMLMLLWCVFLCGVESRDHRHNKTKRQSKIVQVWCMYVCQRVCASYSSVA